MPPLVLRFIFKGNAGQSDKRCDCGQIVSYAETRLPTRVSQEVDHLNGEGDCYSFEGMSLLRTMREKQGSACMQPLGLEKNSERMSLSQPLPPAVT